VLGMAEVSADADFFALGGDSVSSLRLVGRLVREGIHLTVRDVFTYRTPERLADAVPTTPPAEAEPPASEETPEEDDFSDLITPDEFAELAQTWREQD
ncbi:MAG UNVERIFIED_CONTAM: phosphopantetheine-binding protein, partial [Thermobifida fusca]